jgi:mono/diheme cytochrome c family protein
MKASLATFGVGLALWVAAAAVAAPLPGEDYLLHCSGCHHADGAGVPGVVPPLSGLASFLATPAGRAYLVRVPGVAQASLDDERLAALLNWVMREMSGADPKPSYDAREVHALRAEPLRDARAQRAIVQGGRLESRPMRSEAKPSEGRSPSASD